MPDNVVGLGAAVDVGVDVISLCAPADGVTVGLIVRRVSGPWGLLLQPLVPKITTAAPTAILLIACMFVLPL